MTFLTVGRRRLPLSPAASLLYLGAAGGWLTWPLFINDQAPTSQGLTVEAPTLAAASASLLIVVAICRWLDDERRLGRLGLLLGCVIANIAVNVTMSPGRFGIEPVFVVPFLAGVAFGSPAGIFVGGTSCLAATILVGTPSSALPGQAFAWALVGALGGLLARVPTRLATILAIPLAWLSGLICGVALNAIYWPSNPGIENDSFFPGLGPSMLFQRLIVYSTRTSLAVDGVRGVVMALGVLVLAPVSLRALRQAWGRPASSRDESSPPARTVDPDAVERRERVDQRRSREGWLSETIDPSPTTIERQN